MEKQDGRGKWSDERKAAHAAQTRAWWARSTPEQRAARSRGIVAAARTEEHRERMRANRITYGRLGREGKNTTKAAVNPTYGDLRWAAGFLEGEGNFQSVSGGMARASQVNPEPLLELQRYFGGTIRLYPAPKNPKWNRASEWYVCGPRARGVIMTLYSFMSAKRREQMRAALGAT